jgi:hypothetical protein
MLHHKSARWRCSHYHCVSLPILADAKDVVAAAYKEQPTSPPIPRRSGQAVEFGSEQRYTGLTKVETLK